MAADRPASAREVPHLSRWPLAVAPMAGGPTSVDLVVAAVRAGAFGFLAGGYKTAAALAEDMTSVRAAGVEAFGVNVFMPSRPTTDPGALAAYVASLVDEARALGVTPGRPEWDDDQYDAKVEALRTDPPAMVSFTFGCPERDVVRSLQGRGSLVAVTVTTPEEAALALHAGVDCLCLQGAEAGAHRGSFVNDDRPDQDRPVRSLLAAVRRRTRAPLIAAGGVGAPGDVSALLAAGAAMVQVGTAFLRCAESGANPVHKAALADPAFRDTGVTRAYSGRRARGLVNAMMRDHPGAPAAYPEINNATRPLRAAAAAAGDAERMSLYCGTAFRSAQAVPAAQVVDWLVSELPRRAA
jgi:nitronate monooxygenase